MWSFLIRPPDLSESLQLPLESHLMLIPLASLLALPLSPRFSLPLLSLLLSLYNPLLDGSSPFTHISTSLALSFVHSFSLRLGLALATLLHEWAHVGIALCDGVLQILWNSRGSKLSVDGLSRENAKRASPPASGDREWEQNSMCRFVWRFVPANFTLKNSLANSTPREWVACLSPVHSLPLTFRPHVVIERQGMPRQHHSQEAQNLAGPPFAAPTTDEGPSFRLLRLRIGSLSTLPGSVSRLTGSSDSRISFGGWLFSLVLACFMGAGGFNFASASLELFRNENNADLERLALFAIPSIWRNFAVGFWLCAVGCTDSDLLSLLSSDRPGSAPEKSEGCCCNAFRGRRSVFFCGNFGLILCRAGAKLRLDAYRILESMSAISTERGGQSGGLVTFLPIPSARWSATGGSGTDRRTGVRVRVVPSKRQSLSRELLRKFQWRVFLTSLLLRARSSLALFLSNAARALRSPFSSPATSPSPDQTTPSSAHVEGGVEIYSGHTRFATSSIPSANETHPHQWSPERSESVWTKEGGGGIGGGGEGDEESGSGGGLPAPFLSGWRRADANVSTYVTHNGDFEFWNLFGRDRTNSEVGAWLERILHSPQPASCDSVVISGVVELLRTKGMWGRSVRLAVIQTISTSFEQIFSSPPFSNGSLLSCLARVSVEKGGKKRKGERLRNDEIVTCLASENAISLISETMEQAFERVLERRGEFQNEGVAYGESELVQAITEEFRSQFELNDEGRVKDASRKFLLQVLASLSDHVFELLLTQSVENFLKNDLFGAVNKFLSNAKGSFGLCVSCTLDSCDHVVLAAANQPLSVGFSTNQKAVLFSSESQAIQVPLMAQNDNNGKAGAATGGNLSFADFRLDLNEADGEILEIRMRSGEKGRLVEGEGEWGREGESGLRLAELPFATLRLFNLKRGEELEESSLRSERRLIPLSGNPLLSWIPLPKERDGEKDGETKRRMIGGGKKRDIVGEDIEAIPSLLALIRRDWSSNPTHSTTERKGEEGREGESGGGSMSQRSAIAFATMLWEKADERRREEEGENGEKGRAGRRGKRQNIDVLVTGVESSLWVGEQFAADLQSCFPHLRVLALSANKIIGTMGNARGRVAFSSGFPFSNASHSLSRTLVLALSQSGQTFPTLHATRILSKQCPGRVFVCVGMVDSKMAAAVGQSVHPDSGESNRVFWTRAGWRSAEPASASAVSAHATLSELLLFCCKHLRVKHDALEREGEEKRMEEGRAVRREGSGKGEAPPCPLPPPLGLRLSATDITDLERIWEATALKGAAEIVGVEEGEGGRRRETEVSRSLRQQGRKWSQHIVETPLAWFLSALYIFVTVVFQVPLFHTLISARATHASESSDFWYTAPISSLHPSPVAYFLLNFLARSFDALLYLFLPLVFALLIRIVQGRELLARLGKRTIVIADVPYVHQLLEIFVSKMFSQSFWIATVDVHGANPVDHFVHRFTHRVTRGTLLAVGRPDGRLCTQTKTESYVLMALLQARTIHSLGVGAEAISLGHNPHSNPSIAKKHLVLPSNRPKFLCEKLLGMDQVNEPLQRLASHKHVVTSSLSSSSLSRDKVPSLPHSSSSSFRNAFSSLDSQTIGMHLCDEGTVKRARRIGLSMMGHGLCEFSPAEVDDPTTRQNLLSGLGISVQHVLDKQAAVEELCESRFLSLERLIAFQVLFHEMATLVASFPFLSFETHRSQSQLRIATTAAPVSAADLEREWIETKEDAEKLLLLSSSIGGAGALGGFDGAHTWDGSVHMHANQQHPQMRQGSALELSGGAVLETFGQGNGQVGTGTEICDLGGNVNGRKIGSGSSLHGGGEKGGVSLGANSAGGTGNAGGGGSVHGVVGHFLSSSQHRLSDMFASLSFFPQGGGHSHHSQTQTLPGTPSHTHQQVGVPIEGSSHHRRQQQQAHKGSSSQHLPFPLSSSSSSHSLARPFIHPNNPSHNALSRRISAHSKSPGHSLHGSVKGASAAGRTAGILGTLVGPTVSHSNLATSSSGLFSKRVNSGRITPDSSTHSTPRGTTASPAVGGGRASTEVLDVCISVNDADLRRLLSVSLEGEIEGVPSHSLAPEPLLALPGVKPTAGPPSLVTLSEPRAFLSRELSNLPSSKELNTPGSSLRGGACGGVSGASRALIHPAGGAKSDERKEPAQNVVSFPTASFSSTQNAVRPVPLAHGSTLTGEKVEREERGVMRDVRVKGGGIMLAVLRQDEGEERGMENVGDVEKGGQR